MTLALWVNQDAVRATLNETWRVWERTRLRTMTCRRAEQLARFDIGPNFTAYLLAASTLDDAEQAERYARRAYVRARGGI